MAGADRLANQTDRDWVANQLSASWGGTTIVVNGAPIVALDHPCLIACERTGLLIHRDIGGSGVEIVVLEAFTRNQGVGTHLVQTLSAQSADRGKTFITATTTNDNLNALRFYQRLGFRLHEVRLGAVDRARAALKPEIPMVGADGIGIHDEIELRLAI